MQESYTAADLVHVIENCGDVEGFLATYADIYPDTPDKYGRTPIMIAAWQGNTNAVAALAAHPLVNIFAADQNGDTALHNSIRHGHRDIIFCLVAHGADKKRKNKAGETPESIAKEKNCQDWLVPDLKTRAAIASKPTSVRQPASIHAPIAMSGEWSSESLSKIFHDACARNDVKELLRFTDAHKVVSQCDLDALLQRSFQEKTLETSILLMKYGADPLVAEHPLRGRSNADIHNIILWAPNLRQAAQSGKLSAYEGFSFLETQEQMKTADLWRYRRAAMEMSRREIRASVKTLSRAPLLEEFFGSASKDKVRKKMAKQTNWGTSQDGPLLTALYAAAQNPPPGLFERKPSEIVFNRETLNEIFGRAVFNDETGLVLRMIADGNAPARDYTDWYIRQADYGSAAREMFKSYADGNYSAAPYRQKKNKMWEASWV